MLPGAQRKGSISGGAARLLRESHGGYQRRRRGMTRDPDGSPSLRSAEPSGYAWLALYGAHPPRFASPQSRHNPAAGSPRLHTGHATSRTSI